MTRNILILMTVLLINSCRQTDIKEIEVERGTLINNITLISSNSQNVTSHVGYVLIEGDKIVYVGEKSQK